MDWKINYSNGLEMEWINRNISRISEIAADACYQENIRPTEISFRREGQPWYSGEICADLWRTGKLIYTGDLESLISQLMFDLIDDNNDPGYYPGITDAIDPDDQAEIDADLEDALDDMAGDPLDMMKALLDPEDFLQEFERKMQPFTQDAAELDPAELWKGFGI